MNFIESMVLGLVQGLTEFIPVSSTGHLILARQMMDLPLAGSLSFDAILQLATALAVLIYFRKDIWNIIVNKNIKLIVILFVASIPAVIFGLFLNDYMDTIFRGTKVVAVALILGAILFYVAEKKINLSRRQNNTLPLTNGKEEMSSKEISEKSSERLGTPLSGGDLSEISVEKSLTIGFFQCLALIPGMSRSGSTISGGLFSGLNRELATRFSFLLSLPIILGSGLKKLFDLYQINQGFTLIDLGQSLLIASVFAFISGLIAIHFLIKFLKKHSLNYFGVYRIVLAIIILIWL